MALGGLACVVIGKEARDGVRLGRISRIAFGICCLFFGAAHLVYGKETAAMVPGWLPPGGLFWAYATGAAHLLAGLALISGVGALPAARLLTAMFVGFGLLVWLPILLATPHVQFAWDGNAVNFALVAAIWAVADAITRTDSPQAGKRIIAGWSRAASVRTWRGTLHGS